MKALITGASSGLGADMARVLVNDGYEVILIARRKSRLEKIQKELGDKVKIIVKDISSTYNCMELYKELKGENIDILINNAGFGICGFFDETSLDRELDLVDLNVKSLHTLTKLFYKDFIKKDKGYILNVASSAGFMPGPLMATYYASKSYVLNFTLALHEELRRKNSNVSISVLCPGPVDTEFNKVARVKFSMRGENSLSVARYTIKKMFDEKLVIVPTFKMKLVLFFIRFIPRKLLLRMTYKIQERKTR